MQENEYSVRSSCHVFEYINAKNEKGFLHSHTEAIEIILVKQGSLIVHLEQQLYTLYEGDIFVVNPGENHYTEGFTGTHIHVTLLGIGIISDIYKAPAVIRNYISAESQRENKIHTLILESLKMISEIKKNKFSQAYTGNDIYDKNIIKLEIMKIYSFLAKYFADSTGKSSALLPSDPKVIEDYIKNNLEKNISIKDIAKLLNYSESYTGKLIKNMMSGSFKQTLNNHRIDKACELLCDTDYSIEFISGQCGFNSSRAFFKQFKKIIGMSPSQYRKSKFKTSEK